MESAIDSLRKRSLATNWSTFRTARTLGFTSGHCLPGDVVALIDGASVATLLRPVGSAGYRIVGPCYRWARKRTLLSKFFNAYTIWQYQPDERLFWEGSVRDLRQIEVY
jgi:hypothetical protein